MTQDFNFVLESSKLVQLREDLLQTAKFISGEKNRLAINKNVQTVELQLSKSINRKDELDYSKRKRDPQFWNQSRQGDIQLKDLFKQAEELAREDAKNEIHSGVIKKKYIATHGNCVAIAGQAGIGKTTLTKQLVDKIINKELLDIDFLFYVSLNKVNYEKEMSVLEFLLTNIDSSWQHNPVSNCEILKHLDKSEKVVIIFDGLDEAAIELEKQCPNIKLFETAKPEMLLKNCLNGNILRKAKKLITSRPRQILELQEQYRPHLIVDILGISVEAQSQICKDICGDDSKRVQTELFNHPQLSVQCYVPIICILTIHWLHQNLHDSDQTVAFASIANIMLHMLENFMRQGIAKMEFELEKLSKLAWKGLSSKKYEFSEHEIAALEMRKESLNTLLTTGTKTRASTRLCILRAEKITYFSHLILQEFFSAVCLVLFLPFSDFENAFSISDERFGNLDVVKNIVFALCNKTTFKRLTNLQSFSVSDNSDFNKKKLFLEQYVCKIADALSAASTARNFPKYLEVCSLLYEMQDRELTEKVAERFPQLLDISRGNIFPHDVGSLCYVLRERQNPLELTIKNTNFVGDSYERLMKNITVMPECIKVRNDKLKVIRH